MNLKNKIYDVKEFKNIREIMNNSIEKYPENKAFIIKNKDKNKENYTNITYREFGEQINSFGSALINRGLKNKHIAVISPNRYEWALTYYAVLNGTGILVPLDKGLPDSEIESLLQRSHSNAVIFDKKYEEIMEQIKENKTTSVTEFICMDENDTFPSINELLTEGKELLNQGYREFLDAKINEEEMINIRTSLFPEIKIVKENLQKEDDIFSLDEKQERQSKSK